MANDWQQLKALYNAFDPFKPLAVGDPAYVDCQAVRGDSDICMSLGREILFGENTCQLYAGHRGAGKSTELLRLKAYLQEQGCRVVYFAADEADIEPQDTQYADILLACTRHLVEDLQSVDPKPLLNWLQERLKALKELALTEIEFDGLSISAQIVQFASLTANIRAVPSQR